MKTTATTVPGLKPTALIIGGFVAVIWAASVILPAIEDSQQKGIVQRCNAGQLASCYKVRDKGDIKNRDYWQPIWDAEEAVRMAEIDARAQRRYDAYQAQQQQAAEDMLGDLRLMQKQGRY